jgi:HK97 family phage portal protein
VSRLFGGFERRTNPLENPGIPLSSVGLLDWLGGTPTDAGVSVSEDSAFGFSAYWRAVSLLSGLVAGLPLRCYRYKDRSEVRPRVLQLGNPNALQTPFELWETVMVHLTTWGNAYVQKIRNEGGTIAALRPIHPSRVNPTWVDGTDVVGASAKVFEVTHDSGHVSPYTTREIMHVPGLSYDGLVGLSPVAKMRQTLGIGMAADKLAGKLFGNGTMLSGILTTDRVLKQDQADALKQRWREKVAGLNHGHDIAVLDAGTKFTPVSMPPEDAQFLQTRRWQTIEIARWFGIPPHLLGDVEKSTSWGTGIEQQNIAFIAYTLRSWLNRIEQRVTLEITEPATQYAEFLVDGLLRGATGERFQAYALGIEWGWLTRNEARIKENMPPIDGLDEPLEPLPTSSAAKKSVEAGTQPLAGAGNSDDEADEQAEDDDPTNAKG